MNRSAPQASRCKRSARNTASRHRRGAQARRRADGCDERPARPDRARDRAGSRRPGPRSDDGWRARSSELSRHYVGRGRESEERTQAHLAQVRAGTADSTLHRHHDAFRAMLQVNLTVLATAHAVSEGIVRGVNAEIQRATCPNTYTAAGRRARSRPAPHHAARGQPLALSDGAKTITILHEKPRGDISARIQRVS